MRILSHATLLVFGKEPRPGLVKSRLARSVGDEVACGLARAFLEDVLDVARQAPFARRVLVWDGAPPAFPADAVWPQGDGDLGVRMEHAIRQALAGGTAAVLVGTDLPGLPVERLVEAGRALLTTDAALSPTPDGGFGILALRRCPVGLLHDLPWSRPDTRARTMERLAAAGLSPVEIAGHADVDDVDDLERLAASLVRGELCAPATVRALTALGRLPGCV